MLTMPLSAWLVAGVLLSGASLAGQQGSLPPVPATACRPSRIASFDGLRVFNGTEPVPLMMQCGEADSGTCHTVQLDVGRPELYQGDLIAPKDIHGLFTCAMVGGWSGWVPTDRLTAVPDSPAVTTAQWLGTWIPAHGPARGNRLIVTRSSEGHGKIHIEGKATYENVAHNLAYGEVSGDAVAMGPFLHILDYGLQPDCVLDLKYDVPSQTLRAVDNQRCGGFNVTFDGVWRRQ